MKKSPRIEAFGEQMAQSMAELRAIMAANERLTIRTIEVKEPSAYDAKGIRRIRDELSVSQSVFAQLVGVSDVLVRSWERGARKPAPVARRLLDQIRDYPEHFVKLVHSLEHPHTKIHRRARSFKRAV